MSENTPKDDAIDYCVSTILKANDIEAIIHILENRFDEVPLLKAANFPKEDLETIRARVVEASVTIDGIPLTSYDKMTIIVMLQHFKQPTGTHIAFAAEKWALLHILKRPYLCALLSDIGEKSLQDSKAGIPPIDAADWFNRQGWDITPAIEGLEELFNGVATLAKMDEKTATIN